MTRTAEFVLAQNCCALEDCAQSVPVGVQDDSASDTALRNPLRALRRSRVNTMPGVRVKTAI